MTVEEANRYAKECKDQVQAAERSLVSAGREVANSASSAASAYVNKSFFSLLGVAFGIFLWMIHHPVYGTLIIIAGIVICVKWHGSASDKAYSVHKAADSLNNQLSSISSSRNENN